MISVFLRERRRYALEELEHLLQGSKAGILDILKTLKIKGLIRMSKMTFEQQNLNDLTDEDDEVMLDGSDGKVCYIFTYVGIIAVKDVVLKCYPKYLIHSKNYALDLKQALRVIEKYDTRSQKIHLYADMGETTTYNKLAVMIFLLRDYYDYGIYSNSKNIVEENGQGEILWDKTVNNTYALLCEDGPYYSSVYTKQRVNDEQNFFHRLHACILYRISKELEEAGLLDLFDITGVPPTDDELEDFGDDDYILYRLDRELNVQFNTRKQLLLKTMSAYIVNQGITTDFGDSFSLYGTANFNLVWETVCNEILGDQRAAPMGVLSLPNKLNQEYDKKEPLISVIEHPKWYGKKAEDIYFDKTADKTLIPDFLAIKKIHGKYRFIIFDAKYYNLQLEEHEVLSGQPGIESVTKQYLYELAYRDFMKKNGIESVYNCFLFPTEENSVIDKGYVELPFLHALDLRNIAIRFLPAKEVFEYYLSNRKMDIEMLNLK